MSHHDTVFGGRIGLRVVIATIAVGFLLAGAAPQPAEAKAMLWLYPDSDDPNAGGHVVTEPAFTLNIENRGTGGGDNTATEVALLVAVNDPALFVDATITLPGGAITVDPSMLVYGVPAFDCSDATIPPHGFYPSSYAEIAVGDIAEDEIVSAAIVVNGSEGLQVRYDAIGVGYRQAGPNVRCYDIINPPGHGVTQVFEGAGGGACHELTIDKTASATGVALGDPLDYTIVVENTGTCDLTDVLLFEDIPTVPDSQGQPVPAFTITDINPAPTNQTATAIEWNLGTMAPGDSITATVSVVFDQPDADGQSVENTACVSSVELPDPLCSTATVEVGTPDVDEIGGPGFWCNQIRFALEGRPNAMFPVPDLEAWLTAIFAQSTVFPETWSLLGLADAQLLLCRPNTAQTVADRLARHFLTLWFNVASERLPVDTVLGDLCPGDADPPAGWDPTMTVDQLVLAVEADVLAGAPDDVLEFWKDVIDYVNNASLADAGGCDGEIVRRSGNRRHAGHRP
jgi:uncharacterized repeat protein (TIGR01451 family)